MEETRARDQVVKNSQRPPEQKPVSAASAQARKKCHGCISPGKALEFDDCISQSNFEGCKRTSQQGVPGDATRSLIPTLAEWKGILSRTS
jgi:hypothetical protein